MRAACRAILNFAGLPLRETPQILGAISRWTKAVGRPLRFDIPSRSNFSHARVTAVGRDGGLYRIRRRSSCRSVA